MSTYELRLVTGYGANAHRIIFGILYWYVWTVILPRNGGYKLEEEKEILADGTSIIKLVRTHDL